MPVPGKRAGDMTDFEFEYFANAQVLDVKGYAAGKIFENNQYVSL
jgi:hypothetical protein